MHLTVRLEICFSSLIRFFYASEFPVSEISMRYPPRGLLKRSSLFIVLRGNFILHFFHITRLVLTYLPNGGSFSAIGPLYKNSAISVKPLIFHNLFCFYKKIHRTFISYKHEMYEHLKKYHAFKKYQNKLNSIFNININICILYIF